LKSLVSEKTKDLALAEETLACKRAKAEAITEKRIKGQRYGPLKWMLFDAIRGMARTYIGFRENQRFNLDCWITRNRNAYLEIGSRLVDRGYLLEPKHVFFLYRNELRKIVRGTSKLDQSEIQNLVHERYEEFLKYENVTPPKFLQGNREFDDPMPDSADGYQGMPASQGIVSGTVRVLNSIEEVSLVRAGEILVVPRTDPGWTPVFSKIGGLITETGGILSHGAVVSREFGIPAVTNVRNACQIFKTGQRVTVDGNNGMVILLESD
ncbi:MAG: phosphoenolpyruvate protein kinase, partial [Candidatus Thorarchaeota archaeon]|nr:phosphoenolpyruvate protein kinase [Candidatus Thorarchaeota archaeon]